MNSKVIRVNDFINSIFSHVNIKKNIIPNQVQKSHQGKILAVSLKQYHRLRMLTE